MKPYQTIILLITILVVAMLALCSPAKADDYSLFTKGPAVSWLVIDGKPVKQANGKNYDSIEDATLDAAMAKLNCPKCDVKVHVEDFTISSTRITK